MNEFKQFRGVFFICWERVQRHLPFSAARADGILIRELKVREMLRVLARFSQDFP